MKLLSLRFALLAGFLFLCATAPHSATSEIGQTFDGPAGKIYYEVTGTGSNTPLIVVNGGPGFNPTLTWTLQQLGTRSRKTISRCD